MPVKDPNYNPWWARVVFDEYCAHYISMTPEEKAKDVEQSINDVLKKNDKGNSFGAKMVAWAKGRMEANRAARAPGGAKGGRHPKLQPTSRIPDDFQEVIDWCVDHGHDIDIDDARQIWDMTRERDGHDADGIKIENWWGYLVQCLKTKKENRT